VWFMQLPCCLKINSCISMDLNIKCHHLLRMKLYQYTNYIGCVTNANVFSVMRNVRKAEHTIHSIIHESIGW
jgi:hypothetical protein